MTSPDEDPASVLEQVNRLIAADRADEALDLAIEAQRGDPTNAHLTGAVALAASETDDLDGARQWTEWALALDSNAAWLHDLHANVVLGAQGSVRVAQASAQRAVLLAPTRPSFLYTLVRTSLAARDRDGAQSAADALVKAAPGSELGPLARALVSLDQAKVMRPANRLTPWLAAMVVVLSQGWALVPLAIWWTVVAFRRAPHLRRADDHLSEAIELNPGNARVRAMAAEVLRLRFRFARSVNQQVATAALDHGLIDAEQLARSVTGRITGLNVVGWSMWTLVAFAAGQAWDGSAIVPGVLVAMAVALGFALESTGSAQLGSLPEDLRRVAVARPLLPVVMVVITLTLVLISGAGGGALPDSTFSWTSLGGAVAALVSTVVAGQRCLAAQQGRG